MRVIAIKEVWYAGQARHPGDEFEVTEEDVARIWTAHDLPGGPVAREKPMPKRGRPPNPKPEPPVVETSNIIAEKNDPVEDTSARHFYRRRDMTPEE